MSSLIPFSIPRFPRCALRDHTWREYEAHVTLIDLFEVDIMSTNGVLIWCWTPHQQSILAHLDNIADPPAELKAVKQRAEKSVKGPKRLSNGLLDLL